MTQKIYRPHLSTAHDARAVRTRVALRQALLTLLETQPIEAITIRDIAAKAGIGYTTFFRHHPTKEALLDDLAAAEIRGLAERALAVMDAQSVRASSEALFTHVRQHRALWTVLLTGGAAPKLREEFLQFSLAIAKARSPRDAWPPPEVATRLIVSGTLELLAWWLRQRRPLAIARMVDIHADLIMLPIIGSDRLTPQAAPAAPAASKAAAPRK